MNNEFANESPKKDMGFILSLIALLIFTFMGIGIDVDEYLQQQEINIPFWYFILIFSVDILMITGLILIFFYRKIGVFLFPAAVISHYMIHHYYLNTFLYTDVTNLFLFVSIGLLAFIPKWKFFK
ncbi:hypothetical protein [Chryseobacterium sp. MP_3.2]|uniref:hypothetical protein n=1 Tax=Chryseobacterium sp. MP_3.2 TaxID=3071712 RepID=UPI002E07601E|nr:glucan phosphoethanolaminetransferase (alkaline phosphatase superfamily) [Chryseobacterium sp. MP_3.2]